MIEHYRNWVKKWQPILGLADWGVLVRMAHLKDMPDRFCTCCITPHRLKRQALIQIVPEEEWDNGSSDFPQYNPEQSIVHELLHLHFDPFDTRDNTPERMAEEQAIHALTMAFTRQEK